MEAADSKEDESVKKKRITQVILNTPGTCFLCLQDNQNIYGGTINLSNICRYLNINQSSLLLTILEAGAVKADDEVLQQLCSFSVKLCPKCLNLSEKLNNWIIELEKAKQMANYYLQSFHKVLEGKTEKMISTLNLEVSLEENLVQLLRSTVENKSLTRLKKAEAAMPQVVLSKLQVSPPPPPLLQNSSKTPDAPSSDTPPIIPSNSFENHIQHAKPAMPQFNPSKCHIPPPPLPQISSNTHNFSRPPLPSSSKPPPIIPSIPLKKLLRHLTSTNIIPSTSFLSRTSKLYRCPYCFKILGLSKFALHLSSLHSDKLLSSHFPPSSLPPSELTFRQVLHTKVILNSEKIPSSSLSSRRWGCHICGLSFSQGNLLKHHFLINHTDQLIQEIHNFTPPEQSILNEGHHSSTLDNPSNFPVKKLYHCQYCGKTGTHSNFHVHLSNIHPDKLLAPSTSTGPLDNLQKDNPSHFRQLCKKVLTYQVSSSVKIHEEGSGGFRKFGCHLCSKKYSVGSNLKYHFLKKHTDYLMEQLIKLQKFEKQDKQRDKLILKNERVKVKRLQRIKMLRNLNSKTCNICGHLFGKTDKLRRHLVTQHSDKLFLECKGNGVGDKQFGEICKRVFKREVDMAIIKEPMVVNDDKIYKCNYCSGGVVRYKGHVDLVIHLAYQHKEKMEEILKFEGRGYVSGGEVEEDTGGDYMVIEEEVNGSDFDVKPGDIGVGVVDEVMYFT